MAVHPMLPSDEPRARSLGKWRAIQRGFNRYTGPQDQAIGQYALYRNRHIIAGDLTDAWCAFIGLVAQFDRLSIVLDQSITDHAGTAVTYDQRVRQMLQKTAPKRSPNTDYFALLIALNSGVKAAVVRDFDARAESIKIEEGAVKTEADKEQSKKSKDWNKKWGKKQGEKTNEKTDDPPTRWGGMGESGLGGLGEEKIERERTTLP